MISFSLVLASAVIVTMGVACSVASRCSMANWVTSGMYDQSILQASRRIVRKTLRTLGFRASAVTSPRPGVLSGGPGGARVGLLRGTARPPGDTATHGGDWPSRDLVRRR